MVGEEEEAWHSSPYSEVLDKLMGPEEEVEELKSHRIVHTSLVAASAALVGHTWKDVLHLASYIQLNTASVVHIATSASDIVIADP